MNEFVPQQLANTAWAFACLELFDAPLRDAISAAALRTLMMFEPLGTPEDVLFGVDLRGLGWAYSFAASLGGCFDRQLQAAHLKIGKALDSSKSFAPGSGAERLPVQEHGAAGHGSAQGDAPWSVFEDGHQSMVVIFKPPGWEVDNEAHVCGKQLSGYLQRRYPWSAIAHDLEHHWGILHRLDVPSSGLILAGTTFEGHAALKWQLDTARIAREYYIAVHGCSPAGLSAVDAPVHHVKEGCPARSALPPTRSARRSTVCEMGKPALTWLRVLGHAARRSATSSLLAARIRTGRRHQIRTHLLHVAHPTLADGKYVDAVMLIVGGK